MGWECRCVCTARAERPGRLLCFRCPPLYRVSVQRDLTKLTHCMRASFGIPPIPNEFAVCPDWRKRAGRCAGRCPPTTRPADRSEQCRGATRLAAGAARAAAGLYTLVTAELGGGYEINPRYYLPPKRGEWIGLGSVALRDERRARRHALAYRMGSSPANSMRTAANSITASPHSMSARSSICGRDGACIPRSARLRPISTTSYYYSEAAASLTFEGDLQGAYTACACARAYRSPSTTCFLRRKDPMRSARKIGAAECTGRQLASRSFRPGSCGAISTARWSNALDDRDPAGCLSRMGRQVRALQGCNAWLTVGGSISVAERNYRTDIVTTTGEKREDLLVSFRAPRCCFPTCSPTRPILRLDYRYLSDRSNDPSKSFDDLFWSAPLSCRVLTHFCHGCRRASRPGPEPAGPSCVNWQSGSHGLCRDLPHSDGTISSRSPMSRRRG